MSAYENQVVIIATLEDACASLRLNIQAVVRTAAPQSRGTLLDLEFDGLGHDGILRTSIHTTFRRERDESVRQFAGARY